MREPDEQRSMRVGGVRAVVAVVVGLALALAACSDDSSEPATASTTDQGPAATTTTTSPVDWAPIDEALAELAPDVGFLAARVTPDGECEAVHEVEADDPQPIGSQFKLFVLGALAEQIADGRISWDQTLTVEATDQSMGNAEGSLQVVAPGTEVTVEDAARLMISISDNTAADLLVDLVGRDAVEAQMREWVDDPSANEPFLTTKEMFLLHYAPGLGDRYLATPPDERAAFLEAEVDPRPLADAVPGLTLEPRYVDEIEWFGTPFDVCRSFAGLQQLGQDPALAPLSGVMSETVGDIHDRATWPTVWYKGGSEPGVLTLGWLATDADGETYVVEAMVVNPDAALADTALDELADIVGQAFQLLA